MSGTALSHRCTAPGALCVGFRHSLALFVALRGVLGKIASAIGWEACTGLAHVGYFRSSINKMTITVSLPIFIPAPLELAVLSVSCHPSSPQSGPGPQPKSMPPIQLGAFPFPRREPQTLLFGEGVSWVLDPERSTWNASGPFVFLGSCLSNSTFEVICETESVGSWFGECRIGFVMKGKVSVIGLGTVGTSTM